MAGQAVIEAENLTKTYNGFTAVDHLNLRVEEGEIFGFLGPNGAGKTTTILMLLGLTEPTSGIARVGGFNTTREPLKVKRIAGYLPENLGFYEDLTAIENLSYIARLNTIPDKQERQRIPELLAIVGLSEAAEHKVETFSKGMKQRLGIAGVLIKEPRLIILDEPTAGLDPEGANSVLNLIVNLSREQQVTVLLSSHLLHQVQKICHRVGILSRGRLVAEGAVEQLGARVMPISQFKVEIEVENPDPHLVDSLQQIEGVVNVERSDNNLLITCDRDARQQISKAILESGKSLRQMKSHGYDFEVKSSGYSLEEIYLRYFQEGIV